MSILTLTRQLLSPRANSAADMTAPYAGGPFRDEPAKLAQWHIATAATDANDLAGKLAPIPN